MSAVRAATLGCCALLGCEARRPAPLVVEDAAPSPNASIYPSPLVPLTPTIEPTASAAAATTSPSRNAARAPLSPTKGPRDAQTAGSSTPRAATSAPQTPVPTPSLLRPDEAYPSDTASAREGVGVTLVGDWRWPDGGAPPARPEVNADAIASLKKQLGMRWTATLLESGRLRIVFDARSFPVPSGSELRARGETLGHVFVFPSGSEYRAAAPGALRSLFADRRLDVSPLVAAVESKPRTALPPRFGAPVERVEIASRVGTLTLESIRVPEAGVGAVLLCRTLLELAALDPRSGVCEREVVPIRAHLAWPTGPGIVFEVNEVKKRSDLPLAELLVPPANGAVRDAPLPAAPSGLLVSREEAATFRTRAVEPTPAAPTVRAPTDSLLLRNATELLRYATVDGVPVAFVAPGGEQAVTGLPRGRYNVQWRTFLGDAVEPPTLLEVPGRSAVGEPREPAPTTAAATSSK